MLIFETRDPCNEDETNPIEDKKKNKEREPNSIEKSIEIKCREMQLKTNQFVKGLKISKGISLI